MAMTAQNASRVPQKLWPVTSLMIRASVASESVNCCQGLAPTATAATRTYSAVMTASESRMARGRSRWAFFASSPAVEAASKPMYEKNSVAPAALTPAMPSGMKWS